MKKAKKILAAVLIAGFLATLGGCVVAGKDALKEIRHFTKHHHKHR